MADLRDNTRMARQQEVCAKFHKAVELIGRRWSGALIQVLL